MITRIKICGITRPEDGVAAALLGADAIGLVFYSDSPRAVTIHQAQAIVEQLPPFVTVVGLFVNAKKSVIQNVLARVRIDLLQFHGDELPESCRGYNRPYVKALTMREEVDAHHYAELYADSAALLLDAFNQDVRGGSGNCFDWARFPQDIDKPLILAGGLTPDNVAQAIEATVPYAVDVSSGVESGKGIKDLQKMTAFMRAVMEFQREPES